MINQKRNKPMFSVTVDKDLLEAFQVYASMHAVNKSRLIQNFLEKEIKENDPELYEQYKSQTKELDSFIKQ